MNYMSRATRLFSGQSLPQKRPSGNVRKLVGHVIRNQSDSGRPTMNFECLKSQDFSTSQQDVDAIRSLNNESLVGALAACCFQEDCPSKDLESAVLREAIDRLQLPLNWHLSRCWSRLVKRL
ncbi:MAG: hypothetical protein ACLQUR_01865 [Limisphaerales bacterium]